MRNRMKMAAVLSALAFGAWAEVPKQGVPSGCDPSVMSEDYWNIWNAEAQARIDATAKDGKVAFRGFRGRYRLTWTGADGKTVSKLVELQ